MSQYDDDDDFDLDSGTIADIRKALRAAEKRSKALESELQGFRTDSRKRELSGAIESRGLNPKIAAFIPEGIEPSGIGAWLDEYGDVFAPQGAAPAVVDEAPAIEAPTGARTFSEVASSGTAPNGDEGQLMALIQGASTKEELNKLIFGI